MPEKIYPTKCTTQCPDCDRFDTIYRPEEPIGKWSGLWYCDECEWRGYPKDFRHIWNKGWP